MVGQKEAHSLAWLWLHQALGWKHVHFLSMGIGENGMDSKPASPLLNDDEDSIDLYLEEKRSEDEEECEVNSMMANASSHLSCVTSLTTKSNDRCAAWSSSLSET